MKKLFLIIFVFFFQNLNNENNLVYLDVQYIIDNSTLGKHYKKKIKSIEDKNMPSILEKQKNLKKKEDEINNQKNVITKDKLEEKIGELKLLVNDYQLSRNNLNNEISLKKKEYTSNILKLMNPILTNYVEKNNIYLVLKKKDILVGIKSLDITKQILDKLDSETKNKKLINEN